MYFYFWNLKLKLNSMSCIFIFEIWQSYPGEISVSLPWVDEGDKLPYWRGSREDSTMLLLFRRKIQIIWTWWFLLSGTASAFQLCGALNTWNWPLVQTSQRVTEIGLAALDLVSSITKVSLNPKIPLSLIPDLIPTMLFLSTGEILPWVLPIHEVLNSRTFCCGFDISLHLTIWLFSLNPYLGCVFKPNTSTGTTMLTPTLIVLQNRSCQTFCVKRPDRKNWGFINPTFYVNCTTVAWANKCVF